ncbi:hypothetical protein [Chromobacterium sp. CV08]|uniref:hypothetical protein n=1 Tax=Chromobacterium sp. CV08 TaxID=3133274 RepID=UPI003DA970F2
MNASAILSPPARQKGRALAIAASALLHLLALLALPAAMRGSPPSGAQPPVRTLPISVSLIPSIPPRTAPSAAPVRGAAKRAQAAASPSRPGSHAQLPAGKRAASAGAGETRLTIEGLRQQMRRLAPEDPNARPLPENPEKARLARGIDRAERADCKHAYAGLGLLAAPMLLKDAFDKDNGCKW